MPFGFFKLRFWIGNLPKLAPAPGAMVDNLLLENGSNLLLENGGMILFG